MRMKAGRTFSLALVVLATTTSLSAEAPRELYRAAMAREQTVRGAMTTDTAPPAVLADARAVVAAYRAIVRQFPSSGYSDNALWQAGRLSLDTFIRFQQPQDRETGIRLLDALAADYPTSKLAREVPEQLGRAASSAPSATASLATLRNIQRAVLTDAVRIVLELDAEVSFHEERIENPARVFVDLASTRAVPLLVDQTLRFAGDADIVRQVRIGRHPNGTTRVVVDAAGVSSYSVYPLYNPYRLVIDCVRQPASTVLSAKATGPLWSPRLPSVRPRSSTVIEAARATLSVVLPPALPVEQAARMAAPTTLPQAPSAQAGSPARNTGGGFSIARQLGLGVARIVIDPGHGGHDPGAQGKGIDESELVLDVALRLEKLLLKSPGTEVILTRRTDEYIPLQERTAMANREGADLFLSIHANASETLQARGIETYFLNFANSMGAAAVAARENAASGQAMGALPDFVKAIALNNKLDESRDFAADVQRAMLERLRGVNKTVKDLGVKQAPFVVLIGAAMPSVLAEISFVTNPAEAKLLHSSAYRQRIADALFNAIRKYQNSLKNVTTTALR